MVKMKNAGGGAQPGRTNRLTDTNLLLAITVVVFLVMYIGAMLFLKKGFLKPQTFFNILNANAALIITSCGMSLVMITGGIDISVGGVVALVSMSCAVYLDYHGGSLVTSLLIALESAWPLARCRAFWWRTWIFSPLSFPWPACSSPGA